MSNNKPIDLNDPLGMLISINTFKQVSMDIYNDHFTKGEYKYLNVMMIYAAFSIEVGLTYLAGYEKQEYEKGHLWNEHWNQLNVRYKNIILSFLDIKCQNKYNWDFINNSIDRLSDTFVYLRYSFEKNSTQIEPKFVMELMHAVAFVANYRYESKEADLELFEMNCTAKMALDQKIKFDFKML